jgi:hypothetical protein
MMKKGIKNYEKFRSFGVCYAAMTIALPVCWYGIYRLQVTINEKRQALLPLQCWSKPDRFCLKIDA